MRNRIRKMPQNEEYSPQLLRRKKRGKSSRFAMGSFIFEKIVPFINIEHITSFALGTSLAFANEGWPGRIKLYQRGHDQHYTKMHLEWLWFVLFFPAPVALACLFNQLPILWWNITIFLNNLTLRTPCGENWYWLCKGPKFSFVGPPALFSFLTSSFLRPFISTFFHTC